MELLYMGLFFCHILINGIHSFDMLDIVQLRYIWNNVLLIYTNQEHVKHANDFSIRILTGTYDLNALSLRQCTQILSMQK